MADRRQLYELADSRWSVPSTALRRAEEGAGSVNFGETQSPLPSRPHSRNQEAAPIAQARQLYSPDAHLGLLRRARAAIGLVHAATCRLDLGPMAPTVTAPTRVMDRSAG